VGVGRPLAHQTVEEELVGSIDETKGKAKQATGDLTGDKDMKREGNVDEMEGKAKNLIDGAADKVEEAIHHDKK
jgi:uncharacterized protein YjbJ (UPF0337 family)